MLIDVAFVQVRPSPWREAVDLANMMLVLAVRTDAERVYATGARLLHARRDRRGVRRRPRHRQPDAAARRCMKRDGRDLVAQFRALAPAAPTDLAAAVGPAAGGRWPSASLLLTFLAAQNVYGMFTPTDLPIADDPTCGTGRRDDPDGPVGPDRHRGPVHRLAPRRLERRRRGASSQTARGGSARLRPPATRSRSRCGRRASAVDGAVEVPSDEVGLRRFERARSCRRQLGATRTYVVGRRLRHVRLRVRRRRQRVADRRRSTTRSPSNPGRARRRGRASAPASACAASARRRASGARDGGRCRCWPRRGPSGSAARRRRRRRRRRHHDALAAPARQPAWLGHGAARRRSSAGALAVARRARPQRLGLGTSTGWWSHVLAIGIPATMAAAVTIDLLARPGSLALGERAGLVVTPRPVRAVRRRIVGAAALPRARPAVPAGGLRSRRLRRRARRADRRQPGRAVASGARAGRRRLRQARPDRRHPRRPAARDVCDELAKLQNRVPRRLARAHRRRARGRARATSSGCSPSSTGSRWPRRRSARPTGPGCTRASRSSSRCSDPTSR